MVTTLIGGRCARPEVTSSNASISLSTEAFRCSKVSSLP
ncbi:hypothetical protein N182_12985 [Sinorhizobium sp. GL2]|nr:hypothetical protein N182_12985 [Sinorhizobium sp. GL2]